MSLPSSPESAESEPEDRFRSTSDDSKTWQRVDITQMQKSTSESSHVFIGMEDMRLSPGGSTLNNSTNSTSPTQEKQKPNRTASDLSEAEEKSIADSTSEVTRNRRNVLKNSSTSNNLPVLPSNSPLRRQRSNSTTDKRYKPHIIPLISILYASPMPNITTTSHLYRRRTERNIIVDRGTLNNDNGSSSSSYATSSYITHSISELPRIILFIIMGYLSEKELNNCCQTCTFMRYIVDDRRIYTYGRPKGRNNKEIINWVTHQREDKSRILFISVEMFNAGEFKMAIDDLVNANIK